MLYDQIYLGQDGNLMANGQPDNFSKYFDWIVSYFNLWTINLIKNKEIPKTIYIKTDILPAFVSQIFPKIESEFILISGGSDYSPEVNFNREYRALIGDRRLKHWFMNNLRNFHDKCSSLPAGFAAGTFWNNSTIRDHPKTDQYFLDIRKSIRREKKIDKVFCCFRPRQHNDCGADMVIRNKVCEILKNNTSDFFQIYDPDSLEFDDFVKELSKYKYALIPHGNGMDPNPTMWISLNSYTIPVIWETPNVIDMFNGKNSAIFFKNPEDFLDKSLYKEKEEIDFEFLTCEYWANKIKSKIS